jgi:hypothetical protein
MKWTEDRKHEVIRLYSSGMTIAEVAEVVGSNCRHVGNVLKELRATRAKSEMYKGSGNPAWCGGCRIDRDGYVLIYSPDHPHVRKNGTVLEHRFVMEEKLGRSLVEGELVHYKNGVKTDNNPENLEVFNTNADHLRSELTGRCPNWTPEGRWKIVEGNKARWAGDRKT